MAFLNNKKLLGEYAKPGLLWGVKPNRFVKEALKYVKSGDALDIGIGEGRNAIYLAKEGFKVEGVDISESALAKCMEIADKEGLTIDTVQSKIEDYKLQKNYDLIISVGTLHLVDKDKVLAVIDDVKKHTAIQGVNVLAVFTDEDLGKTEHPELYFFHPSQLKEIYKDWQILDFENYTIKESHGTPHVHHLCAIVAKRI